MILNVSELFDYDSSVSQFIVINHFYFRKSITNYYNKFNKPQFIVICKQIDLITNNFSTCNETSVHFILYYVINKNLIDHQLIYTKRIDRSLTHIV